MSMSQSPLSGSPASIKNEVVERKSAAKKTKIRKRVNSAEKRSQHNAIERARRETLNGKFISLARLLPGLAETKRPSKSAIVNHSIEHLTFQREQRLLAAKLLRSVCASHDAMQKELNEWRSRSGMPSRTVSAWTSEMDDICAVESEVFGVFSNEDGEGDDNDNDNDNDEDDAPNTEGSFDSSLTASLSSLITPRSSSVEDAGLGIFANTASAANGGMNGNAMNWANDFSFQSLSSSTTTSSLPFNAFMSDGMDNNSSTGSPANSIQGNVLTPPIMSDAMYTHTPSPRSTGSFGEEVPVPLPSWSERQQQLLFLQSQGIHPATMPVRQQSVPAISVSTNNTNNNTNANQFNNGNHQNNSNLNANAAIFQNLFAQHVPQAHTLMAATNQCDALTQSLLAQMFPSQNVPMESISHWKKMALAGMAQPGVNMSTIRPSVLRSNSMWEQPVEGF